jgi:hypothetical protein
MPARDQQGRFSYFVRVSRPDGTVLRETPFAHLPEALRHFHGMVREAPQPWVYVQLCQHAGEKLEILETGFYPGPAGPGSWYDE